MRPGSRSGLVGLCLAAAALVAFVGAAGASGAKAHPTVAIKVTVFGNGTVSLPGFDARFGCHGARSCTHMFHVGLGRPVELSASPHMTWKLTGWGGACKGSAATCSLGRVTARQSVKVTFVPPGTRQNPYPLGMAVGLAGGWTLKVNSAILNADAQVEAVSGNAPPQPGAQYTLLNISMTFQGAGSSVLQDYINSSWLHAEPARSPLYYVSSCTAPPVDLHNVGQVFSGQTVTGNLCFSIYKSDANTLMLSGSTSGGGYSYGALHTVWLALH